jgi:hypothetical protein
MSAPGLRNDFSFTDVDSPLDDGAGEIGAINLDDYDNFDLMSWAIDFCLSRHLELPETLMLQTCPGSCPTSL